MKMKLALVYQAGIANVFEVNPWNLSQRKRVLQTSFHVAETFLRGAKYAGAEIMVFGCNKAGDITNAEWTSNLDDLPFSDKFNYRDLDNIRS